MPGGKGDQVGEPGQVKRIAILNVLCDRFLREMSLPVIVFPEVLLLSLLIRHPGLLNDLEIFQTHVCGTGESAGWVAVECVPARSNQCR